MTHFIFWLFGKSEIDNTTNIISILRWSRSSTRGRAIYSNDVQIRRSEIRVQIQTPRIRIQTNTNPIQDSPFWGLNLNPARNAFESRSESRFGFAHHWFTAKNELVLFPSKHVWNHTTFATDFWIWTMFGFQLTYPSTLNTHDPKNPSAFTIVSSHNCPHNTLTPTFIHVAFSTFTCRWMTHWNSWQYMTHVLYWPQVPPINKMHANYSTILSKDFPFWQWVSMATADHKAPENRTSEAIVSWFPGWRICWCNENTSNRKKKWEPIFFYYGLPTLTLELLRQDAFFYLTKRLTGPNCLVKKSSCS